MDIYLHGQKIGRFIRKWSILDRYVMDLSSDVNGVFDRRMAVALGALLDAGDQR